MNHQNIKYIIVSPVRNEEKFLRETIECVLKQNILPLEFILVNDGSTDSTPLIIDEYKSKYPWIKSIDIKDRGFYYPGTGIVNTFYKGFETIENKDWDFLVKLDCDLSFEPDYFERIFNEFFKDPNLGIASGATYIQQGGQLRQEKAQEDHPWGASKVYKRKCYDDIGGIKPIPGWDLADLLSAQMTGYTTRCFFNLVLIHHRPTGARRTGLSGGFYQNGKNCYKFGYSFLYTFLKGIYRLLDKPLFFGGLGLIAGYIVASIKKENYIFDKDMRAFLRKKQKNELHKRLKFTNQNSQPIKKD